MHQRAIVFLFLLVNTGFAFDACYALFVIDGSSYWPSFRGEMTSISTTGNLLFSSSAIYANANFWLYGDGDQDQPIPNWFYSTKDDFLDNVAEVESNQGKETIVGATAKLNRWQIKNAVIVLYTASPQNLISIAGYNYTEQYRTLAIHLNDGVDMSPISDYPSPQMSEFGSIVQLIANTCRQLPTEGPTTSESTASEATPPGPSTPGPSTPEPSTSKSTRACLSQSTVAGEVTTVTGTSTTPQTTTSGSTQSTATTMSTPPFAENSSTYFTESVSNTESPDTTSTSIQC